MYRIQSKLHRVAVTELRPTQMTVGLKEVERKQQEWAALGKKKRRSAMAEVLFPAVIGPRKAYFILDHHHSAVALANEHADEVGRCSRDLSTLAPDFWIYLDHLSWVHPCDQRQRRSLKRDTLLSGRSALTFRTRFCPVRSWPGRLRQIRCAFWVSLDQLFRAHVRSDWVRSHYPERSSGLCGSPHRRARYLPGWVGERGTRLFSPGCAHAPSGEETPQSPVGAVHREA
jgi:hypothetical protein